MSKFCPQCGVQAADSANFCMKCGFDFLSVVMIATGQNRLYTSVQIKNVSILIINRGCICAG